MRDFLWKAVKAAPIAFGLPVVLFMGQVKPDDAMSAWSSWATKLHLGEAEWLHNPEMTKAVAVSGSLFILLYAAFVWPVPQLRKRFRKHDTVIVTADGDTNFTIDGKELECEHSIVYIHNDRLRRTQINVLPKDLGAVAFSGGRSVQPMLEHFVLTVDRIILAGGNVVAADGICHVHLSALGDKVCAADGSAIAHDGRAFKFTFQPDETKLVSFKVVSSR